MSFIARAGLGLCIAALCLNASADDTQIKCLPDNQAELFIPAGYKDRLPNGYFTSVKIPGMEEQVKEAFASGKQYWQGVGPGYINVPMNIYVNGERLLVQTDWGLNESLDGGKSWRTISCTMFGGISHWSQYDFDVSPKDPNLIVVCGRQIYRTVDSGKTWAEVRRGTPEPPMLTGLLLPHFTKIKFNCDGSRIFAGFAKELEFASKKRKGDKAPCQTKIIFLGDGRAESFKMVDLKRTFSSIRCIYALPSNPDIVLLSYEDGDLFITRNARSPEPVFELAEVPNGFFVRSMAAVPSKPDEMLATLVPSGNAGYQNHTADGSPKKSKLFKMSSLVKGTLSFEEIPILGEDGENIACTVLWPLPGNFIDLPSIGINPANPNQVAIGTITGAGNAVISDDGCKSFRWFGIPKDLVVTVNTAYNFFQFVWFGNSPMAIVSSRMGAWSTRDGFKTFTPLFMTSDETGKWRGCRGVAAIASIVGISITKDSVYLGVSDHRIWRSDGTDLSRWEESVRVEKLPKGFNFLPVDRLIASADGKHVYACSSASYDVRNRSFLKYEASSDSWKDITPALGVGDTLPEIFQSSGVKPSVNIAFNPQNSDEQWLALNTGKLLYTSDGGSTFKEIGGDLGIKTKENVKVAEVSSLVFDPAKNILYLGIQTVKRSSKEGSLRNLKMNPLYRSLDKGVTFEPVDIGVNNVSGIAVAANGNLIVGTCFDYELPGQLITFLGADPAKKEVKCTIGDTLEEQCMGQEFFNNIQADGNDILAIANCRWGSTREAPRGPLLSTDGGKTFKWIRYNLPCTELRAAAIGQGIIIVGDSANLSVYKYKDSKFKVPGNNK